MRSSRRPLSTSLDSWRGKGEWTGARRGLCKVCVAAEAASDPAGVTAATVHVAGRPPHGWAQAAMQGPPPPQKLLAKMELTTASAAADKAPVVQMGLWTVPTQSSGEAGLDVAAPAAAANS